MSVEYYLLCKTNFDSIIANLNETIENYDDIFSNTNNLGQNEKKCLLGKFQPTETKEQIETHLSYAKYCRTYCKQQLKKICVHEFITDTIDTSPERSKNITYCRICEYTKTD
jgi:hypothetical protein